MRRWLIALACVVTGAGCDDGAATEGDAALADGAVMDAALDEGQVDMASADVGVDMRATDGSVRDMRATDGSVRDMRALDAQPRDAAPDMIPPDLGPPPGVDPAACALPWNGGTGVGVGFPTPEIRMPTVGDVRATIVFVDFPDVAADRTPQAVFDLLSPGAEMFFASTSYGRMNLVLEPHLQWLRLSQPAAHYAEGLRAFEPHRAFIEEAVRLADDAVDFSQTDVVVVMATPNADAIPYGPTWTGVRGWEIEADGNAMTNGITSGTDLLFWGSPWLNHELGHSMGLPDLYDYSGPGGFTRPFSLMDLINDAAPELLAWERWQLGWLDDAQIACDAFDVPVRLTPIERAGGRKAALVRLSPTRALVVESRRAEGYDAGLAMGGVVISVVDAERASGAGVIEVQGDRRPLQPGARVTVDGVTIEVVEGDPDGDTVRLTRP